MTLDILSSLTLEQVEDVLRNNQIGARMAIENKMPLRRRQKVEVPSGEPVTDDHTLDNNQNPLVVGETEGGENPLRADIAALIENQKMRVFCIKSQSRCDRSTEAFISRYLGYRNEMDEKDRKKLFQTASAIRKSVEKGTEIGVSSVTPVSPQTDVEKAVSVCTPIILASATSRAIWDELRSKTEADMRRRAKTLPVYEWVKSIKGFGELGLAIIVGEAGDLSNYATVPRLWKRLGLAVIDGERQRRVSDPEKAAQHGYNPRRRAEIWTLADSMFRHQWTGDKDADGKDPKKTGNPIAVAAHATGPYGEAYWARKQQTEGRDGWSAARRENDARRVMTKQLIEDLWNAWKNVD